MIEVHAPRAMLQRRLRQSVPIGTLIGTIYSVAAMVFDLVRPRAARHAGWEPTLFHTLAPIVGGALTGVVLALVWPARRSKVTALLVGPLAAAPFAVTLITSMTGRWPLQESDLVVAGLTTAVLGLALGAFMYDYDQPPHSDPDEAAAELAVAPDERDC
jgi:hypothetical protein